MNLFKALFLITIVFLYSTIGTTGGEAAGGGGINLASFNESNNDPEHVKQSKAKKLLKAMSDDQALASNRFYKKFPRFYFPEADKQMLMHNACFTGGYLFAGYYNKCIDWSDEVNDCLETEVAPVLMAKADAPKTITVNFYRKVTGSSEQTSGEYWIGRREIEIKSCE